MIALALALLVRQAAPPPPAPSPELVVQRGHTNGPTTFAVSGDGKRIATAGSDGLVKVWNPATGELIRDVNADRDVVDRVALSPDGSRLATSGGDRSVKVWDEATGKKLLQLPPLEYRATALAFAPDGKSLFTGDRSTDGVKQWDLSTGAPIRAVEARVVSDQIAFSADGSRWAVGTADPAIEVHDTATGALVRRLTSPDMMFARMLAFDPNGHTLATAEESHVRTWYLDTGALDPNPKVPDGPVVGLSGDGRWAVVVSSAGVTTAARLADGQNWPLVSDGAVSVVPTPKGALIASTEADGTVRLDDYADPSAKPSRSMTLPAAAPEIRDALLTPDGSRLVVASKDGRLRIWSLDHARLEQALDLKSPITGLDELPDGSRFFVASTQRPSGGTVTVVDPMQGKAERQFQPDTMDLTFLALSGDGTKLLTTGEDAAAEATPGSGRRVAHEWDAATFAPVTPPASTNDPLSLTSAHPLGRLLLGQMRLGATWVQLASDQKHLEDLFGNPVLELTPEQLATADKAVGAALDSGLDWLTEVCWSRDGARLALPNASGGIEVWDTKAGTRLALLEADQTLVPRCFSADGARLLAMDRSSQLRIFSPADGRLRATFALLPPPADDPTRTPWLAYTPAGDYTGSGDAENAIRQRTGEQLQPADKTKRDPDKVAAALNVHHLAARFPKHRLFEHGGKLRPYLEDSRALAVLDSQHAPRRVVPNRYERLAGSNQNGLSLPVTG